MAEPRSPTATRSALAPTIAGIVLLAGAAVFSLNVLFGVGDEKPAHGGGGHGGPPSAHGGPGGGGQGAKKPVRVVDVSVGTLTAEQTVPGEIVAQKRALLRARIGGEVTKLRARLGDAVDAGAVIVELDAGTLPAEVKRADAQLLGAKARAARAKVIAERAERERGRAERLAKDGATSASGLDQARVDAQVAAVDAELAEAEVARAAADVEILRVRLGETRLKAPFAGRIARINVEEGSVVAPGELLVEVVADAPPLVRFSVGEDDVRRVAVGAPIEVRLGSGDATGEVVRVGAAIDENSRTLPVEASLNLDAAERDRALPGTFVRVSIALGASEHAVVVPVAALVGRGPERTAFVVENDVVRQVAAQVLLEDGRDAAVNGLEAGQRVVVTGVEGLKDGAAVEVVQ